MRVFLDANILFSAATTDGAIRRLVRSLISQRHEPVVDVFVMAEARRNLEAKNRGALGELELIANGLVISSAIKRFALPQELILDEKDRPVLSAAIASACDVLVTGDLKHFGHLMGIQASGVTIHSPASLFRLLIG